jgi:hypothetical protein
VNHVSCELPWSTKETPDSNHTKGSIKIRKCLLQIDADNCATIRSPTPDDIVRLKYQKPPIRVIYGSYYASDVERAIATYNIKQGKILQVRGDCGSPFFITEFYQDSDITLLTLALPTHAMRILNAYEAYHRKYDQAEENEIWEIDEDSDSN